MDTVDPEMDKRVREELERECQERGLTYHNLRLRHSGQDLLGRVSLGG